MNEKRAPSPHELTLPEFLSGLRTQWKLVTAVALLVFLGTTLYAEFLPDQYEGEAIVSVAPRPEAPQVSADLVTVGAAKYLAYGTAPSTVEAVAETLGEDPEVMKDAADLTLAPETGDISILAELPTAERAAAAANAFADQIVNQSDTDPLLVASVTATAGVPARPSGPPRRLMEGIALIVGALLGVTLAFVLERGRPRVRTVGEVGQVTGYPVVGRLPASQKFGTGKEGFDDPLVGAAARALRTNIERDGQRDLQGVVIVTSALPGEGKTTTALTLATMLARLNRRVLLVDGDLHTAALSRRLPADSEPGLAGLLAEEGALLPHVKPGWSEGLSILPTGRTTHPGELLALHFDNIAKKAREEFDVVVVDTPPVLAGDDTTTMATTVDGVLLVVSLGSLEEPVREAALALRALEAPVWGVVANRVPRSGPGGAGGYLYYGRPT